MTDDEYARPAQARHRPGEPLPRRRATGCRWWRPWRWARPVIASDIPIFREVGGDAASYVDPGSAAEFAAAVKKLRDDEHWQDVSRRSVARAAEFSWDESARQLVDVAHDIVATRSAGNVRHIRPTAPKGRPRRPGGAAPVPRSAWRRRRPWRPGAPGSPSPPARRGRTAGCGRPRQPAGRLAAPTSSTGAGPAVRSVTPAAASCFSTRLGEMHDGGARAGDGGDPDRRRQLELHPERQLALGIAGRDPTAAAHPPPRYPLP